MEKEFCYIWTNFKLRKDFGLTTVTVTFAAFCNMTSCRLVEIYCLSKYSYCLHVQERTRVASQKDHLAATIVLARGVKGFGSCKAAVKWPTVSESRHSARQVAEQKTTLSKPYNPSVQITLFTQVVVRAVRRQNKFSGTSFLLLVDQVLWLHPAGVWFESQLRYGLFVVLLSSSRWTLRCYIASDHDCFLPHAAQFVIYCRPFIRPTLGSYWK